MYERFVGVALLGIRPCNFTGVRAVPSGYLRPVPAKGKYQGCVAEYLQEPVSALIYCPLTLTLLLTDLTR